MYCLRCGVQVLDNAQFCPNCGAPCSQSNDMTQPVQPLYPAPQPEAQTQPVYQVQPVYQQPAPQTPQAAQPTYQAPEQVPPAVQQPGYQPQPTYQVPEQAPQPFPAQPYPFTSEPAPAFPKHTGKRKKNKKVVIGISALVLAIVLGGGGFFAFSAITARQQSLAYDEAIALLEDGDYQNAYDKFVDLGTYADASSQAEYCQKALQFQEAEGLLERGDYQTAREAFAFLGTFMDADEYTAICDAWIGFAEVVSLTDEGRFTEAFEKASDLGNVPHLTNSPEYQDWQKRNSYGTADQLFNEGKYYSAYVRFNELGDYRDAAGRAQASIQARPGNTEFYHHDGFRSTSTDIRFDASNATSPHYVKVYSGDTLVSTLFVNPGGSTTIQVPPGTYTFKDAEGDLWFGENDMFGMSGSYEIMLFEGHSEGIYLDGNKIYTITLYAVSGGTVGNRSVGPDGF